MRRFGIALVAIAATIAIATPVHAGDAAMEKLAQTWMETFNAGDDAGVTALYAEDAWRMPPNAETAKGKAAIRKTLEDGRAMGMSKIKIAVTRSSVDGPEGWGVGTYAVYAADGSEMDHGKWMITVRKVDGKLVVLNDIFNSDLPLPAGDDEGDG